jgi:hypothetical protein
VLKQKQAHSNQLKAQLDGLLERVFAGPTPEFPDEDQLESDVARCLGFLNDATRDFPLYDNILGLLSQAESEAQQAVNGLSQASNMNTVDMFSDSHGVDYVKQSMIQQGREHADRCNMILNQCRQLMPGLPGLANIRLSGTDLFLDIVFDNVFTVRFVVGHTGATLIVFIRLLFLKTLGHVHRPEDSQSPRRNGLQFANDIRIEGMGCGELTTTHVAPTCAKKSN